jgi:ribonuclease P protein component
MQQSFHFRKENRLKSRKQISALFSDRRTVGAYPLRIFYRLVPIEEAPALVQIGFSVSKRTFKQAVKRNHYKRLMREAYRLHQHDLNDFLSNQNQAIQLMLLYVGKEPNDYQVVCTKYLQVIEKLKKELLVCLSSEK